MPLSINKIKLNKSVDNLINKVRALQSGFPNTQRALDMAGAHVQGQWQRALSGDHIPGLARTVTSKTIQIKRKMIAPMTMMVFTTSKEMDYIEYGHGEIDLKQYLPFKRSYKNEKDGSYYSIIPFRHNVKDVSSMAKGAQIYAAMRSLSKSAVNKQKEWRTEHQDRSGMMISIRRPTYRWGGRLTGLREKYGAIRQIDRLEGMVRMETTAKGAKMKSSAYMTFRVISQKQQGNKWVIPFRMGLPVVQAVMESEKEEVSKYILAGLEKDLAGAQPQ